MTRLWPPGAATAVGSLPGADIVEALRLVFDELPGLPHLPELPARGPGAELIGRGAALLVDLPVEIAPSGWRLTARPGRDLRRAGDIMARDLDALQRQAEEYRGALKIQATGPWTLAASLELPSGHRVISDHGATRELAASLAEGLRLHLADVARRVPGASVVLQLDEPSLPAVILGRVPTPSGYGTVRAIEATTVEQTLRSVLAVAPFGTRAVHCCSSDVPIELLRGAGADALALDLAAVGDTRRDALGEAVEAGLSLWVGVVPATDGDISLESARPPVERLWAELGFPRGQLASAVVPTPGCGLAGATPAYARRALRVVAELGRWMSELG
ncbi:MAG: methionine synthase [Actinomycetota bacterium]